MGNLFCSQNVPIRVDAPDLRALLDPFRCTVCGDCYGVCPVGAIYPHYPQPGMMAMPPTINRDECVGCEACIEDCPVGAITMEVY